MSGKMTLNESLDQSYDRMGIRDTILLETLHTSKGHNAWQAKRCIRCRRQIRDMGVNIPYFIDGKWESSIQYHPIIDTGTKLKIPKIHQFISKLFRRS